MLHSHYCKDLNDTYPLYQAPFLNLNDVFCLYIFCLVSLFFIVEVTFIELWLFTEHVHLYRGKVSIVALVLNWLSWKWVIASHLGRFIPGERERRLGGPQSWSGWRGKFLALLGLEVWPLSHPAIASCHTDYAVPAPHLFRDANKMFR
jgi:hypothetical protein